MKKSTMLPNGTHSEQTKVSDLAETQVDVKSEEIEEPVFHLRSYGCMTSSQLDEYIKNCRETKSR